MQDTGIDPDHELRRGRRRERRRRGVQQTERTGLPHVHPAAGLIPEPGLTLVHFQRLRRRQPEPVMPRRLRPDPVPRVQRLLTGVAFLVDPLTPELTGLPTHRHLIADPHEERQPANRHIPPDARGNEGTVRPRQGQAKFTESLLSNVVVRHSGSNTKAPHNGGARTGQTYSAAGASTTGDTNASASASYVSPRPAYFWRNPLEAAL